MNLHKSMYNPEQGEVNSGELVTVPFMSQTVGQMLEALMSGQPVQGVAGFYQMDDDDENVEPIRPIQDLTEIDDFKLSLEYKKARQSKQPKQPEQNEVQQGDNGQLNIPD